MAAVAAPARRRRARAGTLAGRVRVLDRLRPAAGSRGGTDSNRLGAHVLVIPAPGAGSALNHRAGRASSLRPARPAPGAHVPPHLPRRTSRLATVAVTRGFGSLAHSACGRRQRGCSSASPYPIAEHEPDLAEATAPGNRR